METENIERIIDKSEEEVKQEQNEDEKSINEEEEEMEENNEENNQQEKDNNQLGDQYQENIQDSTQDNIKEEENINKQEDQYQELADPYATSTYILKYKRTEEELKELAVETNLAKSENCLFMLNIKLIKGELSENGNSNIENDKEKESEEFLVICCHEIAAIYFDEIYERIYTLKDLANENKYFKVFESTEEAKNVIDETIRTNEKNAKKIFIAFKDKELKLHMKLSFFDKEKEIVLNIPKKKLTDNDKVNLLPEFLKEIQDKMNHLNEENKKLKSKKAAHINRNKEITNYINNSKIYGNDSSDKKDKINSININNDNNKDIKINEFNGEQINADSNNSLTKISNNININTNIKNDNNNSINNGGVSIHKKGKKSNKSNKKKHLKPEENFF